jgi:hypothetical protein
MPHLQRTAPVHALVSSRATAASDEQLNAVPVEAVKIEASGAAELRLRPGIASLDEWLAWNA